MGNPVRTVLSYVRREQLPSHWDLVAVGDVLLDTQYGLNNPASPDGVTPIVGMKDIRDGRVLLKNLSKVDLGADQLQAYRLHSGDLLINRTNSVDQVGKVGIVEHGTEAVFASYLVRLVVDRSKIEPDFLNLWLNSDKAQRTIKRIATPAIGQANLNPTEFQKYCLVPLPPRRERARICEIQRAWGEAIVKTERLIGAKENHLAWLSAALLFGKLRSAKSAHGYEKHRWFEIPDDWDCPHISEIAHQVAKPNAGAADITVLSCTKHAGLVPSLEYFRRQVFSADTSAYKIVERGQFAYATNHLEEGSIGYLDFLDKGLVSPMYTVFGTDHARVHDPFLMKLFKTSTYLHIFEANTSASVDRRGGLRWEEFGAIRVPLPELYEQREIDEVLTAARREIDLLRKEMKALDHQKRGLMQKLLSGEWRVPLRDGEVDALAQRAAEAAE